MEYKINIYEKNKNDSARFLLGIESNNPLFVIGVNPNTANEDKPDPTLRKVMGFAEKNNFSSFIMLNLYPQRATNPNDMDEDENDTLINENAKYISEKVNEYQNPTILVAWGNLITKRKYLSKCLEKIYKALENKKDIQWIMAGNLTKKGHPRHLLYTPYHKELCTFNIEDYIKKISIKD